MRILLIALTVNLIISFDLNAKIASVIGDPVRGDIYFNVNKDTKNYPASLTKMMTLYIIFDSLRNNKIYMEDKVVFSHNAVNQQPSRLNIPVGKSISVDDIILNANSDGSGVAVSRVISITGNVVSHIPQANSEGGYVNFVSSNTVYVGGTTIGTISAVDATFPEVEKYSGQVMYVENRGAVTRAADQIEDIKLIIEM